MSDRKIPSAHPSDIAHDTLTPLCAGGDADGMACGAKEAAEGYLNPGRPDGAEERRCRDAALPSLRP